MAAADRWIENTWHKAKAIVVRRHCLADSFLAGRDRFTHQAIMVMTEARLYYQPPADENFEELKIACIELWKMVDSDNDRYGYASGKINRIKDLQNIGDNFMYMVAMFDANNQQTLAGALSEETRRCIRERMIDGGNPEYLIAF